MSVLQVVALNIRMDAGDHEYAEGSRAMQEHRYTDAVYFFSRAVFLCPH